LQGQTLEGGPTWYGVEHLLLCGKVPGVPAETSLADFLLNERGKFHHMNQPPLSTQLMLRWADSHFQLHGEWPGQTSGPIPDAQDTWGRINTPPFR
jgi:hypothetical protein